ncbi:MAG TPA: lysylphosphatidylglycerol synthase transmembrane domain-containing protein [Candidatus Kapabacteria bacterium]|nr:lysylphosphatidylglycerol synthase transmembrane domain-containing protein [Candidatus Kapabacteria bacterium]
MQGGRAANNRSISLLNFFDLHGPDTFANILNLTVGLLLAVLPNLLGNIFDTIGWRTIFRQKISKFLALFTIHFSAETVVRTIPGGIPVGDSIKVFLLKKELQVPSAEGTANVIWRRLFLGLSQSIYLFVGVMIGFSYVSYGFAQLTGNGSLAWSALGASAILMCALLSVFFLPTIKIGKFVLAIIRFLPFKALQKKIAGKEHHFTGLDTVIESIKKRGARETAKTVVWYFAVWCTETLETYIYLHVLGYNIAFTEALAMEIMVSALRQIMFFLPSGVGAQDLGYAALMTAMGMVHSPGDAASFILLKRAKDIAAAVIGYLILLRKGIRPSRKLMPLDIPDTQKS